MPDKQAFGHAQKQNSHAGLGTGRKSTSKKAEMKLSKEERALLSKVIEHEMHVTVAKGTGAGADDKTAKSLFRRFHRLASWFPRWSTKRREPGPIAKAGAAVK